MALWCSILMWSAIGCAVAAAVMMLAAALVSSGVVEEDMLKIFAVASSFLAGLVASLGAPGKNREMALPAGLLSGVVLVLLKLAADTFNEGCLFDNGDIPVIAAIAVGSLLGGFMRGKKKKRPGRTR